MENITENPHECYICLETTNDHQLCIKHKTMPLFSSSKFSPKKTPARKISQNFPKIKGNGQDEEMKLDIDRIKLNVGDQWAVFEDGEWIPEGGTLGNKHKETQRLRQQVQRLEMENNFLQLKTEVLLDMLTETTAEAHLQDKEISRLRQELIRSTVTS